MILSSLQPAVPVLRTEYSICMIWEVLHNQHLSFPTTPIGKQHSSYA